MGLNHHRTGSGEPLLLIHGIGSQWQVWSPVLDLLARERDVVALDLPGFGDSPVLPAGTPPTIPNLARAVEELAAELGLERPHVAGNSLGGQLSLELAARGSVRSAVALSPAGFPRSYRDHVFLHRSLRMAVGTARRALPLAGALTATGVGRTVAFAQMAAKPWRMSAEEAAGAIRNLATSPGFELTQAIALDTPFSGGERIEVPVTIAWGEKDRLLLPGQAEVAAQVVPQARRVWLRGCGHVPTWDDPEQVAQVILDGTIADAEVVGAPASTAA